MSSGVITCASWPPWPMAAASPTTCARRISGSQTRVRTDAVLVPVVVTRDGQFVRGLKPQDFEILEDGVRQSIASMASEDSPLDLVLAVDVSGSMEQALSDVKVAVKQFLSKLRQGDAATLVGFNDTLFLATEREKDPQARERAVDLLTAWGGTALYDATVRSVELVSREKGRKGIVIFSDGDDRNSLTSREAATARVQASNAMLYTVGFGAGATVPGLRTRLEDYARSTGGRAFFPANAQELDDAFDQIVAELGSQYVLVVLVDQHRSGQRLAGHPGPRANGQVRHQGQAGLPGGRPAPGGDVIMRIDSLSTLATAAASAALLASAVPSLLAQQTGTDQPAAFRSGVEVVTVDVGVVDRQGQPMRRPHRR